MTNNNKEDLIRETVGVCKNIFDNVELSKGEKKFGLKTKNYEIVCKDELFNSETLLDIAKKIKNFVRLYRFQKKNIILNIRSVKTFADKNTYLILDLLVFYLLYTCKSCKLYIKVDADLSFATHNGIRNTTLYRMTEKSFLLNREEFLDDYVIFRSDTKSYRRIIFKKEFNDKTASIVSTDIGNVLKLFFDEDWIDDICEIISEIVCNAYSHNKSFVLIDIDICDDMCKENSPKDIGESFKSLNISILNFGDAKIYGKIMNNVKCRRYKEDDKVYNKVYKAYDYHKDRFNEVYTEECFFTITAFQKRVTSRQLESGNSGTGLTTLIQNIVGKTDDSLSYVISGKTAIFFKSDFLDVSDDGSVGFNKSNNYVGDIPDDEVLSYCGIFIPGTIYQLHLIRRD